MILTYSYYASDADKLNEFVIAFFDRIEFETGDFSNDFFAKEFYDNLVSRHTGILLKPFQQIYAITKTWKQQQRTELCIAIRESNEIEDVCKGVKQPTKAAQIPEAVKDVIVKLFKQLYKDVLFGEFFTPHYGNRRTHYHDFLKYKSNAYDWCPACGIRPMHNFAEDITDQYDHYLPKDIYPFSSVNFKNLIPICSDCNSFENKSNDDILVPTGKVFFPFDTKHKLIEISISIAKNNTDLDNIDWAINYSCGNAKDDELTAWKTVYKIVGRHQKYCKGKMRTWYANYWNVFTDTDSIAEIPDESKRKNNYLRTRKNSNPFEYKCLSACLIPSDKQAIQQSRAASRY